MGCVHLVKTVSMCLVWGLKGTGLGWTHFPRCLVLGPRGLGSTQKGWFHQYAGSFDSFKMEKPIQPTSSSLACRQTLEGVEFWGCGAWRLRGRPRGVDLWAVLGGVLGEKRWRWSSCVRGARSTGSGVASGVKLTQGEERGWGWRMGPIC